MAEQAKSKGGKGNAQIDTGYSGKNAPIKKQGQEPGTRYGMDPNKRSAGSGKK